MGTIDNKPFLIEGECIGTGSLKVSSKNIVMPDGKTLFDTIIIMNNSIKKLEIEINELKGKS